MRLYEQETLIQAVGGTLRPGSLALPRRLEAACTLPPGAAVLDLGCGMGATVSELAARHRALGIDISSKLLGRGRREHPALTCCKPPANTSRSPPGRSTPSSANALSVVANADRALSECAPSSRAESSPSATSCACRVDGLRSLPFISCLRGAMTQDALGASLRQAGFEIVLWEDHTDALKAFTAQFFAHGSWEGFWCTATNASGQVRQAVTGARPGISCWSQSGEQPMDELERMQELKQQGFYCSQILVMLGLEAQGKQNPDLVRAMQELAGGLGFSGDTCGA